MNEHEVVIAADGKQLRGWVDYQIDVGMLDPADTFTLTVPAGVDAAEVWGTVRPDRKVLVTLDGFPIVRGYIDQPKFAGKAGRYTITGRDLVGRLVDTTAPSINFDGLTLKGVIEKLAAPQFRSVSLSNVRNRRVMRGRGAKARSNEDKVFLDTRVGKRIEPGQMRWAVIQDLCDQAGALAWSSADGRELVVGQPDYRQEVQFRFLHTRPGSARKGNVLDIELAPSTAERYSRILVLGAGAGTDVNFGLAPSARAGEVKDFQATANGEGGDFTDPKVLVLADRDLKSRAAAQREANREAARRNLRRDPIIVTAPFHGQRVAGAPYRTLFAPDLLAYVEDEVTETSGVYVVVACSHRSSRSEGERTVLELLPKDTELVA